MRKFIQVLIAGHKYETPLPVEGGGVHISDG